MTGPKKHNLQRKDEGGQQVSMREYLGSGHFLQATQMAMFTIFTMFLYQKGSSESKDPDKVEEVDREPDPRKKDAPWPVKKGGRALSLYKHSLCYALFLLFVVSFAAHWYGSLKDHNQEQVLKGLPTETALQYLSSSRFWFESFQNWQSEFLSVFAIVVLSIFLRQKNSPQSKPVDAPHSQTGG